MVHILVRHKVKDYEFWRKIYDAHRETGRKGGELSDRVFHSADDPNNLILFFEWDNIENARKFIESPDLKETMERAGVLEKPEIYFLKELEHAVV